MVTSPAAGGAFEPLGRLAPHRARVLREAIANSELEGWAPLPVDVQRLVAVADGTVSLAEYLDAAVKRALESASQIGAPECIEVPNLFPDTVYPGGRTLRNRFGIRDEKVLRQLEFEVGTAQQYGIETALITVPATFDRQHLIAIHRTLFGVLYPWAGALRRYDMALGRTAFHARWIERYLDDAASILHEGTRPRWWRRSGAIGREATDLDRFSYRVAHAYAYLNCAHPFRDGNGRSAKTLLQLYAATVGYRLTFSTITKQQWDSASRESAPDFRRYRPDAQALVPVFTAIAEPADPSDYSR